MGSDGGSVPQENNTGISSSSLKYFLVPPTTILLLLPHIQARYLKYFGNNFPSLYADQSQFSVLAERNEWNDGMVIWKCIMCGWVSRGGGAMWI